MLLCEQGAGLAFVALDGVGHCMKWTWAEFFVSAGGRDEGVIERIFGLGSEGSKRLR